MPNTFDFEALRHAEPFVIETPGSRSLHFTRLEMQSRMCLDQPDWLSLEYTRLMMGFMLFMSQPGHVAIIGLGGGSLAKFCHRHLAESHITAVEVNPHVLSLRDKFHVPPDDERFSVILGDGADFVRAAEDSLDTLLVDGFVAEGIPPQLSSQSFYDDCFAALRRGGMAVFNLDGDDSNSEQYIERIARSFDAPILRVRAATCTNVVVFVCKGDRMLNHSICTEALPQDLKFDVRAHLLPAFNRIRLALKDQRC